MKNNIILVSTFGRKGASGIFFKQTIKFLEKKNKIFIEDFNLKENLFNSVLKIFNLYKKTNNNFIIHAQYGSGCGLIGCFLKGKKIITLRGSDILGFHLKKIIPFLRSKLTLYYLKHYKKVIVMSNEIKNYLIKNKINKNKIVLLTDPIDAKKFYKIDRNSARKKLNLDLKKIYIFVPFISSKYTEKNFELVIKIQNIFSTHKKYSFIIANNKISHDDMVYYYNACNCTLITSIYEGWPNVVKESLWCDTPVVTSNVSDLYRISKKTKYLKICKFNEIDFVKKIIYLCNLERPCKLSFFVEQFNMNNYIKKLNKLYKSI